MQEVVYTKGYETLKEELKEELSKSVESFVRIGYLLKVARDTSILSESPYSNMEEFAYAEFKIDKGTASKFMSINDRFSEDGYSERLKSEYEGIGWSKLSIMLQLPDSINEEITAEFSKSDIQAIREEIAEAEKETPMETLLEGESDTTAQAEELIDKAIRQLGESRPDIYVAVHNDVGNEGAYDINVMKSIMAPSGENMYSIRIRGIGRFMLSVKDHEETVTLVNERTGEKETKLWDDLVRSWLQIMDSEMKAEENWEKVYGQKYPEKEKVAPVQQSKETKKENKKVVKVNQKPEKRSENRKNVTKTEENVTKAEKNDIKEPEIIEQKQLHDIDESVPEVNVNEVSEVEIEEPEEADPAAVVDKNETDEQLPGQMSVQDVPQILPDSNSSVQKMDIERALEIVQNLPKLYNLQDFEEEALIMLTEKVRRRENI